MSVFFKMKSNTFKAILNKNLHILNKMNITYKFLIIVLFLGSFSSLWAQNKDKSEYVNVEPGYYQNSILKDINNVNDSLKTKPKTKRFQMVQDINAIPHKLTDYKSYWRNNPISQGNTGTCWCFSTTSFLESEVKRINNKDVKISEMYTVYCEYIEKAKRFVKEHGESNFSEGAQANSVTRMYTLYGAMPLNAYSGLPQGRKFHTHAEMFDKMDLFLKSVKASNAWNEDWVIATIKSIMDSYIGTPPTTFKVEGKEYTPKTYLKDYLKITPSDYVEIYSLKQEPYWKQVEYKVPDNWWHDSSYYNVPLDVFMTTLKKAVRSGYTMGIAGDVSEAGFLRSTQAAMIPDFDIPSAYINEDARQFRFSNETTTDDHGLHLVGYCEKDGKDWYLVKDSGSGSRNNDVNAPEFGYYFFHEDYIKLKILYFIIHKDAVKEVLSKF
jgi:bleomycin hydrolase